MVIHLENVKLFIFCGIGYVKINICYCLNQLELPIKGNYDPKLYKICRQR